MDDTGILGDLGGAVIMGPGMMLDGVAARVARVRAENGDQPRENGAQQRQKNDCLDHCCIPLRMILPENRCPLFRIMRISPSSD
jgi:hypothetical protein